MALESTVVKSYTAGGAIAANAVVRFDANGDAVECAGTKLPDNLPIGILYECPLGAKSGDIVSIAHAGYAYVKASGAIARGEAVEAADGGLVRASGGLGYYPVRVYHNTTGVSFSDSVAVDFSKYARYEFRFVLSNTASGNNAIQRSGDVYAVSFDASLLGVGEDVIIGEFQNAQNQSQQLSFNVSSTGGDFRNAGSATGQTTIDALSIYGYGAKGFVVGKALDSAADGDIIPILLNIE